MVELNVLVATRLHWLLLVDTNFSQNIDADAMGVDPEAVDLGRLQK